MAAARRASSAIAPGAVEVADHTRHRVALRLLPFLFILYIANYLDRTSVAYAALGMSRDLGFSDRVFGLGAGISAILQFLLQPWQPLGRSPFGSPLGLKARSDRAAWRIGRIGQSNSIPNTENTEVHGGSQSRESTTDERR